MSNAVQYDAIQSPSKKSGQMYCCISYDVQLLENIGKKKGSMIWNFYLLYSTFTVKWWHTV